jgi:hypothetical protein
MITGEMLQKTIKQLVHSGEYSFHYLLVQTRTGLINPFLSYLVYSVDVVSMVFEDDANEKTRRPTLLKQEKS